MIDTECWRQIPGYWDKYEASSYGRIRIRKDRKSRYAGKVLSMFPDANGYLRCWLIPDSNSAVRQKRKLVSVARLVALAFLRPPNRGDVVDHINENRQDNRSVNLRWSRNTENARRASEARLEKVKRMKRAELSCKELAQDLAKAKRSKASTNTYKSLISVQGSDFEEAEILSSIDQTINTPVPEAKAGITITVWNGNEILRKSTLIQ